MDKNNIKSIQNNVKNGKIIWTEHCVNRLNQRDILIADVISTINTGKIIEYYYDDYPYQMGRRYENKEDEIDGMFYVQR